MAEYHIYSGPEELGKTFPSKEFQAKYFRRMARVFQKTPWMISQDAHKEERSPLASQTELLDLRFGIFDDTFHEAWKPGYNRDGWNSSAEIVGVSRPWGTAAWAKEAKNFHITL